MIGLFTAGIAIDPNLAVTAGKQQLPEDDKPGVFNGALFGGRQYYIIGNRCGNQFIIDIKGFTISGWWFCLWTV